MENVWATMWENLEQVRFRQAEFYCPYREFDNDCVKIKEDGTKEIAINGMSRLEEILFPLLKEESLDQQTKEWYFDVIVHYLMKLRFREGVTVKEYRIRMLMADLINGNYGDTVGDIYKKLNSEKQYRIAEALYRQKTMGASIELFSDIFVKIVPKSVLYKNKLETSVLLCSMVKGTGDEYEDIKTPTKSRPRVVWLLEQLFLPLGFELQLYLDSTIGILGESRTMIPENMVLF